MRRGLSRAQEAAAVARGAYTNEEQCSSDVYAVQPLIVVSGPLAGRIGENDDDDFVVVQDEFFDELKSNYAVGEYIRYRDDADGTRYFGVQCQIVYFGSSYRLMTLKSEYACIPDFALRPANINDFVERNHEISREIFELVGADKDPYEYDWEEAFLLLEERNFLLEELWEREVLLRRGSKTGGNVFLCHASEDKGFVRRVAADLKDAGYNVWLDEFEIKPGDSIVEKISLGTERADFLILFVSSSSNKSDWVKREWQSVLSRSIQRGTAKVIPARVEDCELPSIMADIMYADFSKDYRTGLAEIISGLGTARVA